METIKKSKKDIEHYYAISDKLKNEIKEYNERIEKSSCKKYAMDYTVDAYCFKMPKNDIVLNLILNYGYYIKNQKFGISIIDEELDLFLRFFEKAINEKFSDIMFCVADEIKRYADRCKQEAIEDLESKLQEFKNGNIKNIK